MARIRTIKPQFFTSEDVTALEPLARLLFVGLFTECDREGRVEDRPKTLKMRLLPEDNCDVDALLWSLVDGGLIRRYEAGGVNIIQVTGFQRHQKPHPKEVPSILPSEGQDRKKPHLKTAETTQPSMHPVENPSGTVGREGKEYGVSLREGEREPKNGAHVPKIQGTGAYEPGSLPRDHLRHAVCGPLWKICLKQWEYDVLARAYNHPDPHGTRVLIVQFIEQLERSVTPNESIGPFNWVEKNFHTWLKSKGKSPANLKPEKDDSALDAALQAVIDQEAAKKAVRR